MCTNWFLMWHTAVNSNIWLLHTVDYITKLTLEQRHGVTWEVRTQGNWTYALVPSWWHKIIPSLSSWNISSHFVVEIVKEANKLIIDFFQLKNIIPFKSYGIPPNSPCLYPSLFFFSGIETFLLLICK